MMQAKKITPPSLHRSFYLSLLILSALLAVVLALPGRALAAPPGGDVSDPVVRAVDIAKPAVVRIITQVSGHLTVNFSQNNSVVFPQGTGKVYSATLSGSGTFISPNGDILTADHVVSPPGDVLQELAAQDVSNYINQHPELGLGQVSPDEALQAMLSGQLKSSPSYDLKQSEVFYSTDYTGTLTAARISDIPAQYHAPVDQIKKESSFDQKDVAIVHTPLKDTPSVQLGDSSSVQQQDQLTIIGFPGNGDVSQRPTDLLTSSVNTISVSSIKTTDSGAPVIQVGGNVEHGDSGGPALDGDGRVVGIVSFGLVTANSPGGTSFLQASNSARELVQALNLDTTPGQFQKLWEQSFNDYAATTPGHWHKATQGFQTLSNSYPNFKAVTKYSTYAQEQAQKEQAPTPTPNKQPASQFSGPVMLAAAIVVIILLGGVLFATLAWPRRKKKNVAALPTTPAQAGPSADPRRPGPPPARPAGPPQQHSPANMYEDDSLAAFGAPTRNNSMPLPPSGLPMQSTGPQSTAVLRPWPCGHMNRASARFCTICGEPAPVQSPTVAPPGRPVEQ